MKSDDFVRWVEKNRDCDGAALDAAVQRGLYRAKSGVPDVRKFLALAAACAFTLALCFSLNFGTFKSASGEYFRARQEEMPRAAAALDGYMKDIAGVLKKYSGGIQ